MAEAAAARRLATFMARYTPDVQLIAEEAITRVRELLPGAVEMVYDNYNALVIGFGPSERASEAIVSIALYPRWVNLYFLRGAGLPDPEHLLKGKGNQVRNIRIEDASELDKPAVRALIAHALKRAAKPIDPTAESRLVIKAVCAKQRARRPKSK
jgi:hypothetical protein